MKRVFLLITFMISITAFSQSFQGVIEVEITYENLSPEMKPHIGRLPTSKTVYVKDNLSKLVQPGVMVETVILTNSETGEVITLQSGMGNNIAIRSNTNDTTGAEEKPEIQYTEETKEILGYTCKQAIIENDEIEVTIYYTKELDHLMGPNKKRRIDGYPMQTIMATEQFTRIETVTKINEEKVKKIKMVIPADYKEMTMEEIRAMQGGG